MEMDSTSQESGGLNIGNMFMRYLGLLFKWVWRFFKEPCSLWKTIIQAKYKYDSAFRMSDIAPIRHGGPWKSICNHIVKNQGAKEMLISG